jgi:integrase
MAIYRKNGSKVYTMDFVFMGHRIVESTHVRTLALARRVVADRRLKLEEGRAGLRKAVPIRTFAAAAKTWLEMKQVTWEKNTTRIETANLSHLLPKFGKTLVTDFKPETIAAYQTMRLKQFRKPTTSKTKKQKVDKSSQKRKQKAKVKAQPTLVQPKTVNLEIGTLRAILKYTGNWAALQANVKMLPVRQNVGRALTLEDETALLEACRQSRSRSLFAFVVVALYTGARFNLIRNLRWKDIDFVARTVYFGKGKTESADFKTVPLGNRAIEALRIWATQFPARRPGHYVFPSERSGASGHRFEKMVPVAYNTDPTTPILSIKTAWQEAKKRSGVVCRMHDLRHTACSRMIDAGVPLPKIAKLLGWSDSTTVMMARRYGHFSTSQLREAVETINLQGSHLFSHLSDPAVPDPSSYDVEFYGS